LELRDFSSIVFDSWQIEEGFFFVCHIITNNGFVKVPAR